MRRTLLVSLIVSLGFFSGCRLSPDNSLTVRVTYDEGNSRLKTSADKFDCYVASVTGAKLSSGIDGDLASCLALGKMSDVVSLETLRTSGVALSVPAGEPIKIRLFGIEKALTGSCRDLKFSNLLTATGTEMYELGNTSTTAFADTEIEIANTFSANSTALVAACQQGSAPVTETNLALLRAFSGVAGGSDPTSVDFNEALGLIPPVDFESNRMTEISNLGLLIGATGLTLFDSAGGAHKRLDLLYSISRKIFPSEVRGFRVKVAAKGGWISAPSVCFNTDSVSQGNGYHLEVGKAGAFDHAHSVVTNTHADDTEQTLDLTPASDYVTSEEGGLEVFHLSLRSNNETSVSFPKLCSALKISSLSVSLLSN